jgi:hypothetical protein
VIICNVVQQPSIVPYSHLTAIPLSYVKTLAPIDLCTVEN